jgi:hypothetical protein
LGALKIDLKINKKEITIMTTSKKDSTIGVAMPKCFSHVTTNAIKRGVINNFLLFGLEE